MITHNTSSITKSCERCGKQFGPGYKKPGEFAVSRYCSRECSNKARRNTFEHLMERVEPNPVTGCHVWLGSKLPKGYGQSRLHDRNVLVHKAVWEHFKGPVPKGLQLDHLCGNKLCCNVYHLRVVTARENSLAPTSNNMAARNSRRVKCAKCGGPYSKFANGVRYCKACRHATMMAYQRWRRAEKKAGRPGLRRDYKE